MHKIRPLRNAKLQEVPLKENKLHAFSSLFSLSIYPLDAVYTFIPKNACSTLRYSIAIANGFIDGYSNIEWIHSNNETFSSTQREIANAKYTFIVLRCPFTRVASSFLDFIVSGDFTFKDINEQRLSINFHEFLLIIKSQARSDRDQHWRNQSDFLHYETYDNYFALESFPDAISALSQRGLTVHDTRKHIKHGISGLQRIDGNFSMVKEVELKKLKDDGFAPKYECMFTEKEIELVKDIYSDDLKLYESHFGKDKLLF